MLKSIYIFIGVALIGTASCQTPKQNKSTGTSNKKKQTETVKTSTNSNQPLNDNYRFIVSFISKGAGTDSKIIEKFTKYVKEFEQKKGLILSNALINWGKEGELDYCFKLSELNTNDQIVFINESKALLKESDLVITEENKISKHKK